MHNDQLINIGIRIAIDGSVLSNDGITSEVDVKNVDFTKPLENEITSALRSNFYLREQAKEIGQMALQQIPELNKYVTY